MVFVIGEIGINHNGDLSIAKKLIDLATEAGCDAVKFQKRNVEKRTIAFQDIIHCIGKHLISIQQVCFRNICTVWSVNDGLFGNLRKPAGNLRGRFILLKT